MRAPESVLTQLSVSTLKTVLMGILVSQIQSPKSDSIILLPSLRAPTTVSISVLRNTKVGVSVSTWDSCSSVRGN